MFCLDAEFLKMNIITRGDFITNKMLLHAYAVSSHSI